MINLWECMLSATHLEGRVVIMCIDSPNTQVNLGCSFQKFFKPWLGLLFSALLQQRVGRGMGLPVNQSHWERSKENIVASVWDDLNLEELKKKILKHYPLCNLIPFSSSNLFTGWDNPCYICGTTQSEYAFQTSSPVCLQAIQKAPGYSAHPCPITAHTETSHPMGPVPIWHQQPLLPSKPTLSSIHNPAWPSFAWPPHPPWPMLTSRRHASLLRACWHTHVMALCWRPN